jgi:hypothetical protein
MYYCASYGGKLRRIERQIHHYGSSLNSLVLLSAFRSNPSDSYLLRVGYGGNNGPLSNINQDGFAAASFHSWPDTLAWDGLSGDYGPGFLGLALGAGTYVVHDKDVGLVAYGGILTIAGNMTIVQTRDTARRKVFIGPLGLLISIDAGVIEEFKFDTSSKIVSLRLGQFEDAPTAPATVMWLEATSGLSNYRVTTPGLIQTRMGWQIPLSSSSVSVQVSLA